MTAEDLSPGPLARPVSDEVFDDNVVPFAVEPLDVRGRVARLGPSIDHILAKHDYPGPLARLVGEAAVLTVLLATSLKIEGQFQLQTRSNGAVGMLIVDFDAPDRLRALARFDANKLGELRSATDLIGDGYLAVTVDQGNDTSRYQGIVALRGQGLEGAAQQYFDQSVQIPTRVRLAVAESVTGAGTRWRAGGIMTQFLPRSPKRIMRPALDLAAIPSVLKTEALCVEDAWSEAEVRLATIEDHELVDPNLSSERLLYRLFHEPGVRVFAPQRIRAACRCSSERIREMLRRFTPREREDMIGDDGMIGVTCEFCSTHRVFDPKEFDT
jgi:molecular chaperone Hsp33